MISHEYQCVFIHIPKCAGSSIERALGHRDDYSGRSAEDHRPLRMIEQPHLVPAAFRSPQNVALLLNRYRHQYFAKVPNPRNKYTVTRQQYETYFKFSIVRNPWSRAFSWYTNVMRNERHRARLGIDSDMSFARFIRQFAGQGVLRPQLYWVKSFDGSIPLDYLAHFETLADDMATVFDRLGLGTVVLPHEKKGTGGDYRDYYDPDTAAVVSRVYREEIELFGYSFEHEEPIAKRRGPGRTATLGER